MTAKNLTRALRGALMLSFAFMGCRELLVPRTLNLSARTSSCAARSDGTIWCWGDNRKYQLGDGTDIAKNKPNQVGADADWQDIATGWLHTCAIKKNGSLWCWGYNSWGQLGDDSEENRDVPTQVGNESNWVRVSAGTDHTCAIKKDGTLWCWGDNFFGQLGDDTTDDSHTPVPVDENDNPWALVSAGHAIACAVKTNGALYCWGDNSTGRLSNGSDTEDSLDPSRVGFRNDWASVSLKNGHVCAITLAGSLYCWGFNSDGQLGLGGGSNLSANTPQPVGEPDIWQSVSAGLYHSCAIQKNKTLWCWGHNNEGQLGIGTSGPDADVNSPTQIELTTKWQLVECGEYHTCAIDVGGDLWCWGSNDTGQLGNGTNSFKTVPTKIDSEFFFL